MSRGILINILNIQKLHYMKNFQVKILQNWSMKYMVLANIDDLKWEVWTLINEDLDSEKTLIVIQEISRGGNEHKMKEVKQKKNKSS